MRAWRGALLQVDVEGEAIMKRNRRLIVGVTAAGALLLTALVAVIRADYSPRSRDAVASFLNTDAEDLQFVARVDDDDPRARGVLEFWRWTDPDSADIVDVAVAAEPARVVRAEWQSHSPSGGAPSLPKAGALPLALTWASRFAGFRPSEEPSYLLMELGGGRWAHSFTWRGLGPGDERHSITVLIDAATGGPVACYAIYWPLRTDPTMPVRVTQEEAREIAAAAAGEVEGLRVTTLDVADVRTTSPFRPPGEPVYVVTIEGWIVPSGADRECGYADTWGVHATTGELLKAVWEPEG